MNNIGVNNFNIHNVTASVGYQPQNSDNTSVSVSADKFSASSDSSSKLIQDMSALKRSAMNSTAPFNPVSSASNAGSVKSDAVKKPFGSVIGKFKNLFGISNNVAASSISGSPGMSSLASYIMMNSNIDTKLFLSMDDAKLSGYFGKNEASRLKNFKKFLAGKLPSGSNGANLAISDARKIENMIKLSTEKQLNEQPVKPPSPAVLAIASMPMDEIYKMENRDKLSEEEVVTLANRIADDIFLENKELNAAKGEVFSALLNKFGYDALPKVLSHDEFAAKQVKSEGVEDLPKLPAFYRGFEPSGAITTTKMQDDFKYGKLFSGGSIRGKVYGRGTYVAFDKRVAKDYANNNSKAVMEMLLSPDAKIGKYDFNGLRQQFNEEFKRNFGLSKEAKRLFEDVGSFAVLRGYDAYLCNSGRSELDNKYYELDKVEDYSFMVVLNREKVLVKE